MPIPTPEPEPAPAMPERKAMKRCRVCVHPSRPQIDLCIAQGLSKRSIAARFGLSGDSVWRHGQNHLSPEIRAALALRLLKKEGDNRQILLDEGANATQVLAATRA